MCGHNIAAMIFILNRVLLKQTKQDPMIHLLKEEAESLKLPWGIVLIWDFCIALFPSLRLLPQKHLLSDLHLLQIFAMISKRIDITFASNFEVEMK